MKETANGRLSSFSCGSQENKVEGRGRVLSVQASCIKVQLDNGQTIYLEIADCSQLESTKENHVMTTHDQVYFKGNQHHSGNVELERLTCV